MRSISRKDAKLNIEEFESLFKMKIEIKFL